MVTETSIVGMLLNSHDLDTVVTICGNAWQHLFTEFGVCAHFLFLRGHADVAFINKQWVDVRTENTLVLETVWLFRIPDLCTEDFCCLVLHHAACPSRDSFTFTTFPMDFQFVKVSVFESFLW